MPYRIVKAGSIKSILQPQKVKGSIIFTGSHFTLRQTTRTSFLFNLTLKSENYELWFFGSWTPFNYMVGPLLRHGCGLDNAFKRNCVLKFIVRSPHKKNLWSNASWSTIF